MPAPPPTDSGQPPEKRVGLVLGAGGVLGVAWLLGGLSALAERTRWDPGSAERIVGSSAGSIIGAYTAAGVPPWLVAARSNGEVFDGLEGMEDLPDSESEATRFRLHRGPPPFGPGSWRMVRRALKLPKGSAQRKGALILGLLPRGFVSTEPLEGAIRRVVPEGWVDHPGLRVTACDYATGALTAFGDPDAPQVDLATAVAASCAFPPFFHPVKIAGRRYIDGGIRSPSNLDLLAGEGLDLVICLNPLSFPERLGPPPRQWRARMGEALRANARRSGARGREGTRERHPGRRDRADRRGPRADGRQHDEPAQPARGRRAGGANRRQADCRARQLGSARRPARGRAPQGRAARRAAVRVAGPSSRARGRAKPRDARRVTHCNLRQSG